MIKLWFARTTVNISNEGEEEKKEAVQRTIADTRIGQGQIPSTVAPNPAPYPPLGPHS